MDRHLGEVGIGMTERRDTGSVGGVMLRGHEAARRGWGGVENERGLHQSSEARRRIEERFSMVSDGVCVICRVLSQKSVEQRAVRKKEREKERDSDKWHDTLACTLCCRCRRVLHLRDCACCTLRGGQQRTQTERKGWGGKRLRQN